MFATVTHGTTTLLQRPVQWNQALLGYNDVSFHDIKFVK